MHSSRRWLIGGIFGSALVPVVSIAVTFECPSRRFVLHDDLLLDGIAIHAIVVDGKDVSVDPPCEATRGRRWRTKKNSQIRVTWTDCVGLSGRVRLKAATDREGCEGMGGVIRVMRHGRRVDGSAFKAYPSRCGDFVIDAPVGEQCDPPSPGICDSLCRLIATQ